MNPLDWGLGREDWGEQEGKQHTGLGECGFQRQMREGIGTDGVFR